MLQAIQQTATPSSASPTFAGLLAALTKPAAATANRAPTWRDDALADDVATLSYERVLRNHSRYNYAASAELSDRSLTQPAESGPISINEAAAAPATTPPPPNTRDSLIQAQPFKRRPHALSQQRLKEI
jgi:hypothetical protein